jgi:hypothetical protein
MAPESNRVIFGSYNRKDSARVARIAEELASRGITLWLDTSLRPGEDFVSTLEAQIAKADAAIVFVGADGPGQFQRLEIGVLVHNRATGKLPALVPVLLEGATGENAGGFLGIYQHVDFRAKANDPLKQLVDAIRREQVQPATSAQNGPPDGASAHPLVKWFVREMTNPVEIKWFARQYRKASRWPEALYIHGHLMTLALDRRSRRDFAKACMDIGKIYVLSQNKELAERQWALARSVYGKYFPAKAQMIERHISRLTS